MRFLGLDLHGRVPDARTIWLFRELLTRAKAIEVLFVRFDAHLRDRGYLAMGGQMIDASIVAAPRQRNTDAEKADLKAGRVPEDWRERFIAAYDTEFQEWIDGVRDGGTYGPSSWDGYAASVVSDAAMESIATGARTTVTLGEKPELYR